MDAAGVGRVTADDSGDETWQQIERAREAAALYDERARTAESLGRESFPALEWVVEDVVPEGFGLLVAPPKSGKSWMVNGIALACATGGIALGAIPVKQRPVLYMALEDGHRRLQSRFRQLEGRDDLPAALDVVIRGSSAECMTMLGEFLRRHHDEAPLVIVDTLGKVKPPKGGFEDSYAHDYRIGGMLKERIDAVPGGCLLAVHHTRKAEGGDFIDAVSGTQGIAGSADFILVLSRKRHAAEAILSVTGRDVREEEYALTTSEGRWSLDGEDVLAAAKAARRRRDQGNLGDRSTEALAFVCGRSETRPADLADHLGIDADTAGQYLRRLADKGRIGKPGRGLYAPLSEVS